jgi:hypothetical protein
MYIILGIIKIKDKYLSLISDGQTDGWPDGHDEANSRFSQFYERS